MSFNSFGHLLRFTSWGESHGKAIGGVLDGVPPGIMLSPEDIQPFLDSRRPGQSRFTTQRQEPDQIILLSGIYQGKTLGTPIGFMIENQDQKSKDYQNIAQSYRPGHADYTYDQKYGFRDPRGGGRSSARETACRVAVGAMARKILETDGITFCSGMIAMGDQSLEGVALYDWQAAKENSLFLPNREAVSQWEAKLDLIRKSGDSVGALIEVRAQNVPAGWGAPVYGKLDADIASAMMSINAVKSVEIGAGVQASTLKGSQNADSMRMVDGKVEFSSNHAGGISGGISSGQEIIVRFAVKPTSSILTPVETINQAGENQEISTKGRHDPCVGIRAVPVGEAMLAFVLADHKLRHQGQVGNKMDRKNA